jgi:hypothetical protein
MNIRVAIAFVALILTAPVLWAADNRTTDEENKILCLVLKRPFADGGYTVVDPETRLSHLEGDDAKEIRQSKRYIAAHLQTNGIVVTKLVDQLFERNKKPGRLTIKSSLTDGYVIDFDGKYAKYFEKGGGGWEQWYKENPKAHGNTTVSLPVYDPRTGLVLVYTGTQSHWLAGSGWVILYRYENGGLKEINRVMMWIS